MSALIATILRASQHRFIGRLAFDPELRTFDSGKSVCNCRMLINPPGAKRDDDSKPDSFKLEIWNELALSFVDAHQKGALCDVTGRVKSEKWTDKQTGEERTGLVVMVDSWQPIGNGSPPAAKPAAKPAAASEWEAQASDLSDDDIPF